MLGFILIFEKTVEQFEFVCATIVHLYQQKQATIEETEL